MRTRAGAGRADLLLEMLPRLYAPGSRRGLRARLARAFRTLTGAAGCRIVKTGTALRSRPGEVVARVALGRLGTGDLEAALRFRGRAPARSARERAAALVPHARRLLGLPEGMARAPCCAAEVVGRVATDVGALVVLRAPIDPGAAPAAGRLAPRERAVCLLASEGLRDREIAEALGTSPRTVANQLRAASRKLGVSTRWDIAAVLALGGERRRPPGNDEP